ncbi:hypothetical protein Tco_0960959, partial [Tanacetum coccineum]
VPYSSLNGKSPFDLVYGLKPKLSHLRSFGCLCISSILNNSDNPDTSDVSKDDIATSMGDNTFPEGNVPTSSGLNTYDLPENES